MIDLDRDAIVVNPMLTGRFQLAAGAAVKHPTKTAVVLGLGPRPEAPRPRPPFAAWTRGADLAACRPTACRRSAIATRRRWARSTCCRRASSGPCRVLAAARSDRTPTTRSSPWRCGGTGSAAHPGELKNLLRNQSFVAGIGNAYSDEILHAAGLLPFRKRASLAPEEIDALYDATGRRSRDAVEILRRRVPPTFETQVRDFLAVHMKGGQRVSAMRHADHGGQGRRVRDVATVEGVSDKGRAPGLRAARST